MSTNESAMAPLSTIKSEADKANENRQVFEAAKTKYLEADLQVQTILKEIEEKVPGKLLEYNAASGVRKSAAENLRGLAVAFHIADDVVSLKHGMSEDTVEDAKFVQKIVELCNQTAAEMNDPEYTKRMFEWMLSSGILTYKVDFSKIVSLPENLRGPAYEAALIPGGPTISADGASPSWTGKISHGNLPFLSNKAPKKSSKK